MALHDRQIPQSYDLSSLDINEVLRLLSDRDLRTGLLVGLQYLLEQAHCTGGLIILKQYETPGIPVILTKNVLSSWRPIIEQYCDQLEANNPGLFFQNLPELAGIYPLTCEGEELGVMLIQGKALVGAEDACFRKNVQLFSEAIKRNQQHQNNDYHQRTLNTLEAIITASNHSPDDDAIHLTIVQSIWKITRPEAIILILSDPGENDLATRKVFCGEQEWREIEHSKLGSGLVYRCLQDGNTARFQIPARLADFQPVFDSYPGIPTQLLVVIPLSANRLKLGAIVVINPSEDMEDEYLQEVLKLAAASVANQLMGKKAIIDFQVINADLEASRWQLLNSRNMLRALFDHLPASLYIIDSNYTIKAINQHRADRVGISTRQLWSMKCYKALYNRNTPCANCKAAVTFQQGISTHRTRHEFQQGDQFQEWEITTYPISEKGELPTLTILFEQEVTERRKLESQLVQQEKLAVVGQLAAGVAHEINNPLSAIIANIQLIQRDSNKEDEMLMESLKLIEIASLRASQVVRNLLSFARKEQMELKPCDLNRTIRNAVALVQHEFIVRPTQVMLNLADELPMIEASGENLQAVWMNLLLNALDAMNHDHREIKIQSGLQNDELIVVFEDNGFGIPTERLDRIFEPFYTSKASGHGTGLGLSVCQQVIKQHNGYIKVDSAIGVGTKFTVTLPLNRK